MNTPPRTDSFPNPHNGPLKALASHPNMTPTAPLTPPQEPSEGHHEPPKFLIGGDEATPCGTVPEEDEDHDNETSSSIAEPVTPPAVDNLEPVSSKRASMTNMVQPTIVNVPPTPPSRTPLKGSPPSSQVNLKRSTSRLSTLFRRSTSNANMSTLKTTDKASDPSSPHTAAPLSPRIIKNRHSFFHTSTTTNTPVASAANTPPAEPSSAVVQVSQDLALSKQKTNVAQPQPRSRLGRNRRASSMNGIPQMLKAASDEDKITAIPDFTRPAPTGVGLKSRRISIAAPRVKIEVGPLSAKYTSASHVPLKSKTIGSGATAVVKLFKKINAAPGDDTIYAVKEYRHRSSSETEQEFSDKVNSEYTLSHSLHHPNVVETFDLCMSSGHRWCAVMEYCGGGDLFSLIEARFMGEAEKLCVFKQMMRGIAYLHNHGIAHRDIKPENLLMREDGHLKITDFGVSEVFTGEHPGAAGLQCGVGMTEEIRLSKPGICGSEPYLSPEVLSKKDDYDPRKLDVWAAGCVTLILHHHGLPWLRASRDDAFYTKYADAWDKWTAKNPDQIITDDNYPNGSKVLNSLDSKCLKRILLRMMHPDPTKRVTANDVLNDRWVKNIECCTLDHADDHTPGKIDCSKKSSCKNISKLGIKRMHQHTPPQNHRHSGFFHHH